MKQLLLLAFIFIQLLIPCLAQDKKVSNFELQINNRKLKYEAVIPNSLTKEFFDDKASGYITKPSYINDIFLNSILDKVKLVSISRDVLNNYRKVIRRKGKIVGYSVGMVSHPSFFQSVILGRKLYVIEGFDKVDGLSVFNQLVKDLKISVNSPDKARQISEFYLLFYTINFRSPKQIIISKVEDIPEKKRNGRLDNVAKVKATIQPLKISKDEGNYDVNFFTWEDFPRGEVNKWQIKVSQNGEISLSKEFLTII